MLRMKILVGLSSVHGSIRALHPEETSSNGRFLPYPHREVFGTPVRVYSEDSMLRWPSSMNHAGGGAIPVNLHQREVVEAANSLLEESVQNSWKEAFRFEEMFTPGEFWDDLENRPCRNPPVE